MTALIDVWALVVIMFSCVVFAGCAAYYGSEFYALRTKVREVGDDADFYRRRVAEQTDAWAKERARSNHFIEQLDAASKMINDQRSYNLYLRGVIDPEVAARCRCCRRCGPIIPCREVIETAGESCQGACFCGSAHGTVTQPTENVS
jgi:hypothetical protein